MPTSAQFHDAAEQLTNLANRDLDIIWRQVASPEQASEALHDVLPALVDSYGAAAATVAADWYDDQRAQAAVRGRFTAIPAVIDDTGSSALVGWALSEANDFPAFQSLILGGVQRRISDFARQTVMESSIADPGAMGWQRETSGGCAFCEMLAGRGTVYSEESADFASHDNCQCQAVPAFEGESRPVQAYTPSSKNITDADRARVREYIRTQ